MNTKKGFNLNGFLAASSMASTKFSDCPWSEAACNNNNTSLSSAAASYLTANQPNLMARFSLNSSLALNTGLESDATSSSTSSISAPNNSSNSLSGSPAAERDIKPLKQTTNQNTSNHLLELQREIKEEEEEIFADINSLINSRSNLYSALNVDDDEDDGVNLDDDESQSNFNYTSHRHQHHHSQHQSSNNNVTSSSSFHDHKDNHLFASGSTDDLNDYQSHSADDSTTQANQNDSREDCASEYLHLGKIRINKRSDFNQDENNQYLQESKQDDPSERQADDEIDPHYMDDEDFGEHNEDEQQNYQALQAVIQQVTSNLPKPCVFFLEGNCRRSDCKYSHDLSNITCKYWIEGFCFKGELCPFLHSYTPMTDTQDPNFLDEEGLDAPTKKKLTSPTFVIESEADFPSLPLDAPLGALCDSTTSGINTDALAINIENQILSSNPAVVFKTVKKKRKRG